MSNQVFHAAVTEFKSNIYMLLNQADSRFRGAVTEDKYHGEAGVPVEQFGSVDAREVTSRYADIVPQDIAQDRRWVYPTDWDIALFVDEFDKMRTAIEPTGAFTQRTVESLNRKIDDTIIKAMTGTAKSGKTGSTNRPFLASQTIDHDNVGLTAAKLKAAKKMLMAAEVDIERDPIYCAISAEQHDNLLNQVEITSTDFNTRPVFDDDGMVKRWLGINFIHSERLLSESTGERINPVWVKSGMHLGTWNEIQTDISPRRDKQGHPMQVYARLTLGAVRLEEEKVVKIQSAEEGA